MQQKQQQQQSGHKWELGVGYIYIFEIKWIAIINIVWCAAIGVCACVVCVKNELEDDELAEYNFDNSMHLENDATDYDRMMAK